MRAIGADVEFVEQGKRVLCDMMAFAIVDMNPILSRFDAKARVFACSTRLPLIGAATGAHRAA